MTDRAGEVVVVETGVANVASVDAALRRAGAEVRHANDPAAIRDAAAVVLPGVGTLRAGMQRLTESGAAEALRARIAGDLPTLCVCLGMQLLFDSSDESPGVEGLGLARGHAGRFPAGVRTPQFGWNRVEPDAPDSVLSAGYAYFANSFRVVDAPEGWAVATADHGGRFVAAMRRGRVVACQFHPELSGPYGRSIIDAWLNAAGLASSGAVAC
ncbi:MAG: imidazole glycerol phosphate synthase subunit HisH [Planctomycetota bacterium]